MANNTVKPVCVGISQGDINGIGLEVIMKTFSEPAMLEVCTPVLFSSGKTITAYRKLIQEEQFNYNSVSGYEGIVMRKFNLFQCYNDEITVEAGRNTPSGGKYAILSLMTACDALAKNKIDALVTAPINKNNTYSEQFPYAGHTQFLDEKFGKGNSLMMLVSDNLKVALATEHIPVAGVATTLKRDAIIKKLIILVKTLIKDFGIDKPKIAVLGLNPHAGDNGTLGNEESEIIYPAIQEARRQSNTIIMGTYSADGFFGSGAYSKFDAVMAMYHDQGLIPFKQIAFENGVNFTAGLPVVRTSPDHGTAYDIAGKNKASESSFRAAVYLACDLVKARKRYVQNSSNPLKASAANANQKDE